MSLTCVDEEIFDPHMVLNPRVVSIRDLHRVKERIIWKIRCARVEEEEMGRGGHEEDSDPLPMFNLE